ncbi:hypothetical protein [Neisseria sp. 74A18]|uniref:hypothetical protein n=1 Tax=Neisseria sp. 74A18 TaxID=1696094 RepID=UPI0006CAEB13|nr:hypothetical protein [Neisseria sp. 74A18]KPN73749.1 hypothetical protein AKG43_06520 [Neisseria sp. 74A18]
MNLITRIFLISFVFYSATVYIVSDLENQYPYTSLLEFICFNFIIFISTFFIIRLAITAINLKKNCQNLIRVTVALVFLIGIHITIEDNLENKNSSQAEYTANEIKTAPSATEEKVSAENNKLPNNPKNGATSSKSTNNNEFWDSFLKFISKLFEIIAIGSLAGFILSYREEPGFLNRIRTHLTNFKTRFNKSESKNEQAENTTENNQTDTTKSEPEQSSEEKESPHG